MLVPPSPARVIRLVAALTVRRWWNTVRGALSGQFKKRRRGAEGAPRRATAGKRRAGVVVVAVAVLFGAIFMFNGIQLSSQAINKLSLEVTRRATPDDGRVAVAEWTYSRLQMFDPRREELGEEELAVLRNELEREVTEYRTQPGRTASGPGKDELLALFRNKGLAAFKAEKVRFAMLPSPELWAPPEAEAALLGALGLLQTMLFLSLTAAALGGAREELGKVEWHMTWLFTFPVQPWALFLGRGLATTFTNVFAWFTVFPLLLSIFIAVGHGWRSLAEAAAAALCMNALVGAVKLTAETQLRKRGSPGAIRNLQAFFGVAAAVLFLATIAVAAAPAVPGVFFDTAAVFPSAAFWLPWNLPLLACRGGSVWPAVACVLAFAAAAACLSAAVWGAARCVRGGLVTESSTYRGTRAAASARPIETGWSGGIAGKDLRLLVRDRTLLVQAFIVPVLVIAVQLVFNPQLLGAAAGGNLRHLAALAFGVGAYALLSSAFMVLAVEGKTLWLLYTFPRRLEQTMRTKAMLWGALVCVYPVAVFALAFSRGLAWEWTAALFLLLAVGGVFVCALVAAGIGIMATDPFAIDPRRSVRQRMIYAYLFVASMYAYAMYAPSAWHTFTTVVLFVLLAGAVWQKAADSIPFLLDPDVVTRPVIGASDGVIAAIAFSVVEGLALLVCRTQPDLAEGARLVIAYTIAGAVVTLATLVVLRRRRVPDVGKALGTRADRADAPPWTRAAAIGAAWGIGAGAFGLGYLAVADRFPALAELKEETLRLAAPQDAGSLACMIPLMVIVAPLLEEFLFRGVLFRGFRRTLALPVAVLASAALFAICHPVFSAVPVFALGVATALSFERTRLLVTPVCAHACYNAITIAYQLSTST